jgi:hypothetical protein
MQKLTIMLGPNIKVNLESPDLQQLIKDAAFWSELPQVCPLCRASVVLFYRNPKGNDYYGLRCVGPQTHETNFGQFKETAKGFYYKGASSWKESIVHWDSEVREDAAPMLTPAPPPVAVPKPAPAPNANNVPPAVTVPTNPIPAPARTYAAPDDDIPF